VLTRPEALALAAAFLFGLAVVVAQFGVRRMTSLAGTLVSMSAMAVVLWAAAAPAIDWRAANLPGLAIFIAAGLVYPGLVAALSYEANRRMGPAIAGALGNLTPLFAVPLAAALLGEIPRLLQLLGIAVILVGVVLLSRGRHRLAAGWPWWAPALPIGAAAVRGFSQPLTKLGLAFWPSPVVAVLIAYTTSALVFAAASALPLGPRAGVVSWRASLWFVATAACNGLATLLLYLALAGGQVVVVSPLVATYPLVTLAFSWLLLRALPLDRMVVLGVAVTVVGIAILIRG
jgi:drug/metabolite transporter (DMT)-like permease